MPIALTTRQINALRVMLERRDFSVDDVAALDYEELIRAPGIGGKSVGIIRAWLAEHGRDLRNSPSTREERLRTQRMNVRLEKAVKLLRRYGYRIEAPVMKAFDDEITEDGEAADARSAL